MKYGMAALAAAGVLTLGVAVVHVASADEDGWDRHGRGHGEMRYHGGGMGFHHGRWGDDGPGRGDGDRHGPGGMGPAGMGERFGMMFDLLDVNADDNVSREEAMRPAEQRFARIDVNSDGSLSADEAAAAIGAEPGRYPADLVERFDADGDGAVSAAEFAVRARAMFAMADADNNGTVSFAEFDKLGGDHHGGPHRRAEARGPMMDGNGMADDDADATDEDDDTGADSVQ